MTLSGLDSLLWAAGLAGHVVLLFVLLGRHRVRQFPFFTALIASNVFRSVVLFFTLRLHEVHTYFLVYWSLGIIDVVLQIAVVYEMASKVFRPLGRWAADARRGMTWLIAGSLLTAAVLSWLALPVSPIWKEAIVAKGSFFSSALMSELFVGMVFLSLTVGLPWRTHVARISQGLGVFSMLDIAIEAAHTLYGKAYHAHVDDVLSTLRMVLYLACVGYWIVTLWQNAPEPRELSPQARLHLRTLQARVAYDLYTLRSGRKP